MIYVWKTLNYKIYEMTTSYTQYSKKIKACCLTRKTIILQVEQDIIHKLWKRPLNIANILNNSKSLFIQIYAK